MERTFLIAHKLDDLGVDYIEGGYLLSNPKDEAFFEEITKTKFERAKLAAFGMTRRKDSPVEDDIGINVLVKSKALGDHVVVGFHGHNDSNLAVANSPPAFTLASAVSTISDSGNNTSSSPARNSANFRLSFLSTI